MTTLFRLKTAEIVQVELDVVGSGGSAEPWESPNARRKRVEEC